MKTSMDCAFLFFTIIMIISTFALMSFGMVFISELIGISIKSWFIAAVISSIGFIGVIMMGDCE